MGNSKEVKVSKPEKPSSPATDQDKGHVYPDWAAMQAYYGPRLAVPPYMNSAIGTPHTPPPYMWGPQSMIPPYAAPYAAFYAHPGVYAAHPSVTVASTTMGMDTPAKSAGNGDGGFMKNLKDFDGLTMSIGNANGDSADHGNEHKTTDSEDTGGSSDGSNSATPRANNQDVKKRSRQSSANTESGKPVKKSNSSAEMEIDQASEKKIDLKPAKIMDHSNSALDLTDPAKVHVPHDIWLQNERELKRERRKQSNRESARRSRLRKQAEAEELAVKVQLLTAEKMTLKSEISKLMENSEKLRLENATLMEKLKNAQLGQTEEVKIDNDLELKPIGTVNLLERVNNSSDSSTEVAENDDDDDDGNKGDTCMNTSPKAKLHQLLDASPRSDAVASC